MLRLVAHQIADESGIALNGSVTSSEPVSVGGAAYEELRAALIAELRSWALFKQEVTLSSGKSAKYYIDAKRALMQPKPYFTVGALVTAHALEVEATAVGGLTMGADPVAFAVLSTDVQLKPFLVRKERKEHGLQRWIEGPPLEPGERCLVVDDVVTTGNSTIQAVKRTLDEGFLVVGVVSVLDRLEGGAAAIREVAGAPYWSLTTIDDVYPDRPDREA